MSILLTGASGFIGRYLSLSQKISKRVVRERSENDCRSVITVEEIDSKTKWNGAFSDIHTVIHLAGLAHSKSYSQQDYDEVNVKGTLNLARSAVEAGVKRFVFVSSIGVNGTSTQDSPLSEKSIIKPHNAYAKSKYAAEVGLNEISEKTGLEVVIVRPPLVYGANAPGNFGALCRLIRVLPILPFGAVSNKRSFIAVQNLADLLLVCATHPDAPGKVILASDGKAVSTCEFTNSIASGLRKRVIQIPAPVLFLKRAMTLMGKKAWADQLLGDLEIDSSHIKESLGWTPPYTLQQAMASLYSEG